MTDTRATPLRAINRRKPTLARRIASVLILVCLVLPMSRCATSVAPQPIGSTEAATTYVDYVDVRPVDFASPNPGDWWIPLAFAWPALSQLLLALRPRWEIRRSYLASELVLTLATAGVGYWLTTIGLDPHPRYGIAVLAVALALYATSTARMFQRPAVPRMEAP